MSLWTDRCLTQPRTRGLADSRCAAASAPGGSTQTPYTTIGSIDHAQAVGARRCPVRPLFRTAT